MEVQRAAAVNAAPPHGHLIAGRKWRESGLIQSLKGGGVTVLFEEGAVGPGGADFLLPGRSSVLYVSEREVIAGSDHRRRLVRYRNACSSFRQLVLVENTPLSRQYFPSVQRLAALDLGLTLLPVGGQTDASALLLSLVHGDRQENPFRRRGSPRLSEPQVLASVRRLPGVGRVKARSLLRRFPSLLLLSEAAPAQLEPLVGAALAEHIHGFFRSRTDDPRKVTARDGP